ncbi:exopolysaccharide biosynthesis polyprenyl glycosylphosphotransferase [Haloechinothrix alba]|uniref:Exopolysaccharide biosynthesis polyprenyl glycosylphosphotransferase n=2 Tax=Haloechinothrix alba TaxID=664784 RepID=A0A238WZX0_9PSEU|nr:sugar transferase [Haloechinothrix alba]SNR52127.1 exopolysaccharide biosynthesis polyprenyl glycosylphosphotransferase [Haloechinothrix alba]
MRDQQGAAATGSMPDTVHDPAPVDLAHGSRRGKGPGLDWERRYRATVVAGDVLLVLALGAVCAVGAAFGAWQTMRPEMAVVAVLAMLTALPARRAWAESVLDEGVEEYRAVIVGTCTAAVVIALIGTFLPDTDVRPWVFVVVPTMGVLLLVSRYVLRQLLHRARRSGACLLPVLAAGDVASVRELIARTREHPHVGWRVEAACVVAQDRERDVGEIDGVPVIGGYDTLTDHVRNGGYRVVAVAPAAYWTSDRLQHLAWNLEGTPAELAVAPTLMDVGGTRLNVTGILGLPMLRVTQPAFTGAGRLFKEVADRVGAAALLMLAAPLMLAIAVAVKLDDGGPVFYRQRRVKRDGAMFTIWKFRTMRTGADAEWAALAARENDSDGPLFKLRGDPRVTRAGAVLRRFSLDELPQLLNVLGGSMSLVGPRPALPEETQAYGPVVGRRLLVKPGMTGLWQVSGRSDLSWQEAVRLDLRYVDDWSPALDLMILWKTARAVLHGKGAY